MGTPTYIPLANITLSSSAASVTFSSISQAYRDLVLVSSGMGVGTRIRLNADTGANYYEVYMEGTGSATGSQSNSGSYFSTWWTGAYEQGIINLMDYSATDKHKSVLMRYGQSSGGVNAWASRWANTAAVTQIQLYTTSTFAAGSTFALYGIAA